MIPNRQVSGSADFSPKQQLAIAFISKSSRRFVLLFCSVDFHCALATIKLMGNFGKWDAITPSVEQGQVCSEMTSGRSWRLLWVCPTA